MKKSSSEFARNREALVRDANFSATHGPYVFNLTTNFPLRFTWAVELFTRDRNFASEVKGRTETKWGDTSASCSDFGTQREKSLAVFW